MGIQRTSQIVSLGDKSKKMALLASLGGKRLFGGSRSRFARPLRGTLSPPLNRFKAPRKRIEATRKNIVSRFCRERYKYSLAGSKIKILDDRRIHGSPDSSAAVGFVDRRIHGPSKFYYRASYIYSVFYVNSIS